MLLLFQVCFFVGIALIIISLLLGSLFDIAGMDGLNLDFGGSSLSLPVSPVVFVLFLAVFGGSGWMITEYVPALLGVLALLIAIVPGLIICFLVQHFIVTPLKKAQNTSTPEAQDLIGLPAVVSESILERGFGEIRYVINGNSYTSPAKSIDGIELKAGVNVAICWIEGYVFYVTSTENI
ncbi:hypothetical protein SAMN02745136_03392 [Anaerocolumna jejuensis DSM 15929]|uniref:Membrane protein NfeD2 N-terminal transmembrane domain-containing protein n=1 Tax=Anaerocolumna jejuensis DSM 15929 TaxID=1121322 RepID=A0A1M6VF68_9FIRM|nr:hypothetical protein [Anaerocolumna jejuensis]SHK80031.1 hypothetical protein SAMN02745136_03392 [Anaerocolumna jejuensis DSM 15929]